MRLDEITLDNITTWVVAANDKRLEGQMTREEHALVIARMDHHLKRLGYTWDDIHANHAR
jgi:hypothetical protein